MNADWAQLESLVVDGLFTLQRCIGSTDHSGVFLAHSAPPASADVALKLIPVDPKSAQAQLARWQLAARLNHPHLLRILQVGVCRLHEKHYLYAAMEYADQTLAQLLERRALTEDEARDMLVPTLDALEFLHGANLVHGGLEPSNILVVGDQLKLASDGVRIAGGSEGGVSVADDVRSLGTTLSLALMRAPPPDANAAGEVAWPTSMPASFREVVARCTCVDPRARPTVTSLRGWLRGEPLASNPAAPALEPATAPAPTPTSGPAPDPGPAPTPAPASASAPVPVPVPVPEPVPSPTPATAAVNTPAPSPMPAKKPDLQPHPDAWLAAQRGSQVASPLGRSGRGALPWILGAVAVAALLWAASRRAPVIEEAGPKVARSAPVVQEAEQRVEGSAPAVQVAEPPSTPDRVETASAAVAPAPGQVAPQPLPSAVAPAPALAPAPVAPTPEPSAVSAGAATLEVMPVVAQSALETVRGTIRVALRADVDRSGAVVAVSSDEPGPSRYFERRCIDAAKKWTFAPAPTDEPRSMRIVFAITRAGVTANATPLP